jgi:hypothetical protein
VGFDVNIVPQVHQGQIENQQDGGSEQHSPFVRGLSVHPPCPKGYDVLEEEEDDVKKEHHAIAFISLALVVAPGGQVDGHADEVERQIGGHKGGVERKSLVSHHFSS